MWAVEAVKSDVCQSMTVHNVHGLVASPAPISALPAASQGVTMVAHSRRGPKHLDGPQGAGALDNDHVEAVCVLDEVAHGLGHELDSVRSVSGELE